MLGIGSGAGRSGKVRKIVKNGLQAWYKCDATQAPLGEEEIANGDFSLGPELVTNRDFSNSLTSWDVTAAGTGKFTANNSNIDVNTTGTEYISQMIAIPATKNGLMSITISNYVSGTLKVYIDNASGESEQLWCDSNGTFTKTNPGHATHSTARLYLQAHSGGFVGTINDISVRQTNPNDSWTLDAEASMEDGLVLLSDTGDGGVATQTNAIVSGKKYQYNLQAKSGSGTSGTVKLADGTGTHLTQASVPATYTTYTGSFTAENTSITFSEAGSGGVYVKDVSIKEITNSVRDYSKNNNNAVLYSGKALDFDGTGDYIVIADDDSLDVGTGDFTLAAWVYCDTLTTGQVILSKLNTTTGYQLKKGTNGAGNYLYLEVDDGGGEGVEIYNFGAASALAVNTWYRIVVVADRDVAPRLYINGEFISAPTTSTDGNTWSSISSSSLDSTAALHIGAYAHDQSLTWFGMIADVQLYKKAWTASDVTYDWENPDGDVFDDEGRAEVLGAELVTNGDLTSGLDNWTTTNTDSTHTVTHTSKGARFIADTTGVITTLSSPSPIIVGGTYKLEVVISEFQGSAGIKVDNGSITPSPLVFDSVGTFVYTFIATAAISTPVSFYRNGGDVDITIQSVSVKEVITHASTILPTDCKALYRLNEGAGDRVYNAAPVLSAEMWDGANGDISNWQLFGDGGDPGVFNTAAEDSGAVKITYVTSSSGGYIMLRAAKDLKADLVVGGTYEISFSTKVNQGSIVWRCLTSGGGINATATAINSTSFETRTMIVVADHETDLYIHSNDMTTGDIVWIKDISVKEVSLSNSYALAGDPEWATAQPYIPQYAMSSYSKKAIFGGASSGDYVALGSEVVVAADEAASISFWFTYGTTDTSTDKYILGKASGATDYLIINPQSSGVDKIQIQMNNQTALAFNIETDLTLGKVYHCVVTIPAYSSGSEAMKCYINGVQQSDTENRTNDPWDFQWIGALTGSTNNFDGILDEFAHFSKELSATEVSELFNGGMALDARDHSAYLGSEIVADGGFDTDVAEDTAGTYWITQPGWTVSNGSATYDGGGDSNKKLKTVTNSSFIDSKIHKLVFDLTDTGSGGVYAKICEGDWSDLITGTGTKTVYITAGTGINRLEFETGHDDKAFTIDNVSVKEVDLKGYWRNNGVDTWTDLSEYGNNGTVNGSPTTIQLQEVPYFGTDSLGLPMNRAKQGGLLLDGSSYVTIDDSADFDFGTTGFTIQAWVKPFSLAANDRIITKGTTDAAEWMISVGTDNASVRVYAEDSGNAGLDSASTFSTLTANTWSMITVVVDTPNDQILFYKDNGSVETYSTGTWSGNFNGTAPLRIGTNEALSPTRFDGIVDDVKIYNRVLSATEKTKNYKKGLATHKSISTWSDDFDGSFG